MKTPNARELVAEELTKLNTRMETLLEWLLANLDAENFETTYRKYTQLQIKQVAVSKRLDRIKRQPVGSDRIGPQHIGFGTLTQMNVQL